MVILMRKLALAACCALFLTACDTAEERAENHYQAALELMEEGDVLRALVELRNVFQLNGQHREARRLYAETVLDQGELREAYGQYLRLVEQYPADVDANRQLAILSVDSGNFAQTRQFLNVALADSPEDTLLMSIQTLLDYSESTNSDREKERQNAIDRAEALLADDPALVYARQVQIDNNLKSRDWTTLIDNLDTAIENDPSNLTFFRLRLTALEALGMNKEIEETLLIMTRRFPENKGIGRALLNWYGSSNDLESAESWLRDQVNPNQSDPSNRLDLIRFLQGTRGEAVALEELTAVEGQIPQPQDYQDNYGLFASMRAGMMFNLGQTDAAILRLEDLIANSDANQEQIDRMKVALAQMYEEVGNRVGARALVSEVLEGDGTQIGALKMMAEWQIQDDDPEAAISNLRVALDQAPEDASVMSILATAYERQGSRELMLDIMARAVEASGRAPDESIRLAKILETNGEFRTAESVLIESLRINRYSVRLLETLALLHMEMSDWSRVEQGINQLRDINSRDANAAADRLETQTLLRQRKTDDLLSFVESQIGQDERGEAAVVRALVLSGRTQEAFDRAKGYYDAYPDLPLARFVYAATLTYLERDEEALPIFEELVDETPNMLFAWSSIYRIHSRAEDMVAAEETLERAQAAMPGNTNIQWLRAGHEETVGNIEAAIAIYEEIYEENSNLPVIANNLASLISVSRSDDASIERAYLVARRLRDSDIPEFADTYGWIASLRGDHNDALEHLIKAAEGLPNEASVHYHLGATYVAMEDYETAMTSLRRAELLVSQGGRSYPGLQEEIAAAIEKAQPNTAASIED